MKIALLVLLAVAVLWALGERHRADCERDGRNECSVLLWKAGQTPKTTVSPSDCALLREAAAYQHDPSLVPPQCR